MELSLSLKERWRSLWHSIFLSTSIKTTSSWSLWFHPWDAVSSEFSTKFRLGWFVVSRRKSLSASLVLSHSHTIVCQTASFINHSTLWSLRLLYFHTDFWGLQWIANDCSSKNYWSFFLTRYVRFLCSFLPWLTLRKGFLFSCLLATESGMAYHFYLLCHCLTDIGIGSL
jgi:hypothetical protein